MKSRDLTLLMLLGLLSTAVASSKKGFRDDPPDPKNTCVLKQSCNRRPDQPMETEKCPDGPGPTNINNPQIDYFEPSILFREESKDGLRLVCPQYDPETPICCNDDQVEILGKIPSIV